MAKDLQQKDVIDWEPNPGTCTMKKTSPAIRYAQTVSKQQRAQMEHEEPSMCNWFKI